MLKLVDKPDLGSGAERRMGSIPFARTKRELAMVLFFLHTVFTLTFQRQGKNVVLL